MILVGMTTAIVHQFQNGQSIGQAAQAVTAIAYFGTAFAAAVPMQQDAVTTGYVGNPAQ
ncbi:hypothetical protein TrispH2_012149, partial [Trichoplax sp. H2]